MKSEGRCGGFCACARLRDLGVSVVDAPTPAGELGYFDPDTRQVVVRPGLNRAVRRATIAHELAHVEVHDSRESTWWAQLDSQHAEDCADEIAARELLPLTAFVDALTTGRTVEAVASQLDVDPTTVRVRVATFTAAERRYVERRMMPRQIPQQRLA